MNNLERPLPVFFGNHNCASTFILNVLQRISRELGLNYYTPYWHDDNVTDKSSLYQLPDGTDIMLFPESNLEKIKYLPKSFKGFHLRRDPRDIIVSAYFSHKYSHSTKNAPKLQEHRKRLSSCNKEEGIKLEIAYSELYLPNPLNWDYSDPRILDLSFDELIADTSEHLMKALHHIGLIGSEKNPLYSFTALKNRLHAKYPVLKPFRSSMIQIPESRAKEIIEAFDFKNSSDGRKKGEEDITSHYRKGVAGDWKNHFTREHEQMFYDKYPDILQLLSYSCNS